MSAKSRKTCAKFIPSESKDLLSVEGEDDWMKMG